MTGTIIRLFVNACTLGMIIYAIAQTSQKLITAESLMSLTRTIADAILLVYAFLVTLDRCMIALLGQPTRTHR